MAQDIISGLFGLSPSQIQRQQNVDLDLRADRYASQTPFQQAAGSMYRAGGMLGNMGAGMMGYELPQIEEAKMTEAALTGLDISDPKAIFERAQQIQEPRLKMKLMILAQQKAAEIRKAQSDAAKISLDEARARTQDALAAKAILGGKDKEPTSVEEYKYAVGQGYKGTYEQWLKKKASEGRAPDSPFYQFLPTAEGYLAGNARTGTATPLTVNGKTVLPAAQDPALQGRKSEAEARGTAVGKGIGSEIAALPAKQSALESVQGAIKLLDDGIYSGFWGPTQRTAVSATPFADKKKVANTDTFIAYIGEVVVPRLKEFGGNDSNEELRKLTAISGGDLSMQESALRNILKESERKIKRGILRVNRGYNPDGTPKTKESPSSSGASLPPGFVEDKP